MTPTVAIDIPADRELLVRRFLALTDELDHLALTAPDGHVLDACEAAVIAGGRDVQQQVLRAAIDRRVRAAEKKTPRSAPATAAGPRRTAAPRPARS